mgnify:CR=1 FL=1
MSRNTAPFLGAVHISAHPSSADKMRFKDPLLAAAIIAVMGCVFAVALTEAGAYEDEGPFSIDYELNGGFNDESNPSEYVRGDSFDLLPATRDGAVFTGWYSDPDLEHLVRSVRSTDCRDLTLYAGWDQDGSRVCYTYDVVGYRDDGVRTMKFSGTQSFSMMYYNPYRLAYYTAQESDLSIQVYRFNKVIEDRTSSGTESFWMDSRMSDREFAGYESIDTVNGLMRCMVLTFACGDGKATVWSGADDGVPYKVVLDGKGYRSELTFMESSEVEIIESVKITAFGGKGIMASVSGSDRPGLMAHLSAEVSEGVLFGGWFDSSGKRISGSLECDVEVGISDASYYALTTSGYDLKVQSGSTFNPDTGFVLTDGEWSMTCALYPDLLDTASGSKPGFTVNDAGTYRIEVAGTTSEGKEGHWCLTVFVAGTVDRVFEWAFDDKEYTYTAKIPYEDYVRYVNAKDDSERHHIAPESDASFVTRSDPTVVKVASDLKAIADQEGFDAPYTARFILSFVQAMGHVDLEEEAGGEHIWKYPVETLFAMTGDSEDTSILYCALMSSLGYRTALLLFPDHVAAGLETDGVKGVYYSEYGIKYHYCETSMEGYEIGKKPSQVASRVSVLVEIPLE